MILHISIALPVVLANLNFCASIVPESITKTASERRGTCFDLGSETLRKVGSAIYAKIEGKSFVEGVGSLSEQLKIFNPGKNNFSVLTVL